MLVYRPEAGSNGKEKREMPTMMSGDDARAGVTANRMIYVLWIGLAGAIIALALVLFFR
jgi:hypothetical protein